MLQQHEPAIWCQFQLLADVVNEEIGGQLSEQAALKLWKISMAIAVKQGVSDGTHIDSSDDINTFAMITGVAKGWSELWQRAN